MPSFTCATCGSTFQLSAAVLDRYPGWTPSKCRSCRDGAKSTSRGAGSGRKPTPAPANLDSGVFTDGSAEPNPGVGGWGVVWVRDGKVVAERSGGEPDTTNNRMELRALIEAYRLVPEGTPVTLWSDSNLVVRTVNEWAAGWEQRGWKRSSGPVQNLDLVQELYGIARSRPEVTVAWIKAHVGHEWNEYADRLAARGRTEQ